jgi:hypothetical protein
MFGTSIVEQNGWKRGTDQGTYPWKQTHHYLQVSSMYSMICGKMNLRNCVLEIDFSTTAGLLLCFASSGMSDYKWHDCCSIAPLKSWIWYPATFYFFQNSCWHWGKDLMTSSQFRNNYRLTCLDQNTEFLQMSLTMVWMLNSLCQGH